MEWGGKDKFLETFQKMHGRKPKDYRPPPPVDETVAYYVKAFYIMHPSRTYTMGGMPGYLDLGSIQQYITVFGRPYDLEMFVEIIFAIDHHYLPKAVERMKAMEKKQPKPNTARMPQTRR